MRALFLIAYAGLLWLKPHFVLAEDPANTEIENANCLPLAMMLAKLEHDYQERGWMTAVNAAGAFVVLMAADDGSTWTSLVVNPKTKMACIVGVGTDVQIIKDQQSM